MKHSKQFSLWCSRPQEQAEEDLGAHPRVRAAQGHDSHPSGHRRPGAEGVERSAAQLLLLPHLHQLGHVPAVQEDRQQ